MDNIGTIKSDIKRLKQKERRLTMLMEMKRQTTSKFKFKDPGSAISHLIFTIIALIATPPLLLKAYHMPGYAPLLSMILFMLGVILLYSASTIYHSFDISIEVNTKLKKIDHMMIYILIAGSYSPICLIALGNTTGLVLFIVIWVLALIGIFQALFFIHCPKWVNSTIYIAMGWSCIFSFTQLINSLSRPAFLWLLAGGIIYTIGGVIYALKLPIFNGRHKNFGSHEIFHLFCIGGTLCHYILMYYLV